MNALEIWLHAMSSRWVVAMLAGPPCNTWSRARARQVAGDKRLPRPVRGADCLWGLQCLSIRELRDVCMGNLLLGFSLMSMLQLSIVEGTGILEHPAEPSDDELPSTWKLSLVQLMLRPGFDKLRVLQGLFGSQSPRPRDLMTLNLPTLCHDLHSWRLTPEPPRTTSIGCQADGQFATAKLKEYPPSFCAGMATAFLHVIY